MSETKTAQTEVRYAQPVKVTLSRGQRGGYGWEISVQGETLHDVLSQIDDADLTLRAKYALPSSSASPSSTEE